MNVELLRQIADVIEKNPECHDQSHWSNEGEVVSDLPCIKADAVHNCGTTACIAGWAVHLTPADKRPKLESVSECAEKLLGLGEGEGSILFLGDWKPRPGRTVHEELRRIADQQSIRETVTGGYRSTVTGGYASTVTGGDRSTVTGGNRSTVTGGDASTVTGGYASTVTGGDDSILIVYRIKNGNRIPVVGIIGETLDATGNPLKPKTKYTLNDDDKFVEQVEAKS